MSEDRGRYRFEGDEDYEHMAEALRLAANGLYDTKPNPSIGCVLVSPRSRAAAA